jgi:hypothetical protein
MTISNLIRWSGLVAILAGLSSVAASFLQQDWVLLVNGLLLLGFLLASIGNALVIGAPGDDPGIVAGSSYALGLILLGIGSWRAAKFPRWVPVLWLFAVLIGFPGFFIESLMETLFLVGQIALGLGFIAAGYALWSQKDATAEQVSAV